MGHPLRRVSKSKMCQAERCRWDLLAGKVFLSGGFQLLAAEQNSLGLGFSRSVFLLSKCECLKREEIIFDTTSFKEINCI